MVRFFIGQAVTGQSVADLNSELEKIYEVLEDRGHSSYDTLREGDRFEKKSKLKIMEHAFAEIRGCDAFLAIVRSEKKSEGMLMEIGYCLANRKRIVLVIKRDVKDTYLRELADVVIEYEDSEDMIKKLKEEDY